MHPLPVMRTETCNRCRDPTRTLEAEHDMHLNLPHSVPMGSVPEVGKEGSATHQRSRQMHDYSVSLLRSDEMPPPVRLGLVSRTRDLIPPGDHFLFDYTLENRIIRSLEAISPFGRIFGEVAQIWRKS